MFEGLFDFIMDFISWIHWKGLRKLLTGRCNNLNEKDFERIKRKLKTGYYIVLTEDRAHMSSWAVKLGNFCLTGKFGRYTHALVNVEEDDATEFEFVEAVNIGVKKSTFEEIFQADSCVILKPKRFTQEEIDEAVGRSLRYIGRKYDKHFKYNDSRKMSCVEVIRFCLKTLPDYDEKMRIFEYMISFEKNLTPQMIRDCPDFEVVLEIKR